jgi:hypothetical protein
VARDLAAYLTASGIKSYFKRPRCFNVPEGKDANATGVEIVNSKSCKRYAEFNVSGVKDRTFT